jgi:hypothetical protein
MRQYEERLGQLAMEFRGTREAAKRKSIAGEYEQNVVQLIHSGKWNDMPAPEDQLPDDWMPKAFFEYWSCRRT